MKFYYVYVLQEEKTKTFYIGFTRDLRKRIEGHNSKDTKTTKGGSYKLIYYESYLNKADAVGREKFLKGGSGHKYLKKQLFHFLTE